MRKLLLALSFLFIFKFSDAGLVETYLRYADTSTVTADNLNGNLDNIRTVLNGGVENVNVNTRDGFRLYEVLGVLPPAGNQGRTVFYTVESSLNFDTGSEWYYALTLLRLPVQGDTVYFDGTHWVVLNKNTSATRYISNTGTNNNPAWAQVNMANGVTGTLAIGNGGTGQTTAQTAIDALLPSQSGKSGYFLTSDGTNASWGVTTSAVYTSGSGNWTCPTGISTVYVTMCGGGGAGGGDNSSGAGGGGGAQSLINIPYTVVPASTYAYSVGAGGTWSAGDGTAGGNSTFGTGTVLTCTGGNYGTQTGVGGAATLDGFAAQAARVNVPNAFGGGAGSNAVGNEGGAGGNSRLGSGGNGGSTGAGSAGGLGAGGGGGDGSGQAGGAGGSGIIILMY